MARDDVTPGPVNPEATQRDASDAVPVEPEITDAPEIVAGLGADGADGDDGDDGDDGADGDGGAGGAGGAFDFGAMMQMASDLTEQIGSAQAELAEARVEGTAGGGVVKVVLNGHLHLLAVEVDARAVDRDDPSVLGDLVVAAWRDAHDEVARLQAAADPLGGLGAALGGDLGDLGGLLGGG